MIRNIKLLVWPVTALTAIVGSISLLAVTEDVGLPIFVWAMFSMGLYWVLNRFLHAHARVPGETECDGRIWMLPLSSGLIPLIAFLITIDVRLRALTVLIWGIFNAIAVQFVRPELSAAPEYLEPPGFSSFLRSLFKYRLDVSRSHQNDLSIKKRYSASTVIYYGAFTITACCLLYVTDLFSRIQQWVPEFWSQILRGYFFGLAGLFGTFGAGVYFAYRVPKKRVGWPIQDGESQILVIVYAFATFTLICATLYWFAIPLMSKVGIGVRTP